MLHGAAEQLVEEGDVGKASRAYEGFEKITGFDVGDSLVGMELEELLAGGKTAQAAQHAKLAVMDVGKVGAAVFAQGLGIALDEIRKKSSGQFIVNVLRVGDESFSGLRELQVSMKSSWNVIFWPDCRIMTLLHPKPRGLMKMELSCRAEHHGDHVGFALGR